jgi:rhodanese-related sulfurtransferase
LSNGITGGKKIYSNKFIGVTIRMNTKIRILSMLVILGTLIGMACAPGTSAIAATAATPQVQDLYAGRNMLVGTVSVWNTPTDLFVRYTTAGDWELAETHLAVASSVDGIPQTKTGNPIPGKFANSSVNDPPVTQYTYTIPIANDWRYPNAYLKIAAYAAVRTPDMEASDSEGSWASGEQFSGTNWATYINYSRDLSPAEVCSLIQEPGVVIIDVRAPSAFTSGHIPGAININFLASPSPNTFINAVNQLDKTRMYLVYCGSGNNGYKAAVAMRGLGFVEVFNVAGGYSAWTVSGGCP